MCRKLENAKRFVLRAVGEGEGRAAVEAYTADDYRRHTTGGAADREQVIEAFEDLTARHPVRDVRVVRGIQDGRHVFLHVFQSLDRGATRFVAAEFFEADEDGRLVRHWDATAPFAENHAGHTSIDGPTEPADPERTEPNKALVREMIRDVFMPGGQAEKLDRYIDPERFVTHRAVPPEGVAPLRERVAHQDSRLVYEDVVVMAGQGDMVASLSRARRGDQTFAQADLFRVEDGRIVEHWEISEAVPPEDEAGPSRRF